MGATGWTVMAAAGIALATLAGLLAWGTTRWRRGTDALRARLEAARRPLVPTHFEAAREPLDLPRVVQRYFRTVLSEGQPLVAALTLEHRGQFNLGRDTDRWCAFTSCQRVVAQRPGFDWDARIALLPGLPVHVHDAYVGGQGLLHAALMGAFTLARSGGTPEIARGELMRWLAEAPWYPSALLPSQGVLWTGLDDRTARATIDDGGNRVSLDFSFGDDGLIDGVYAAARERRVGGDDVPTPWQGRFWHYETRDGMRVPLEGEAAWVLPAGPKPYWRGTVHRLRYEFAGAADR